MGKLEMWLSKISSQWNVPLTDRKDIGREKILPRLVQMVRPRKS